MFARNYLKYQEDQSSPALGTENEMRCIFLRYSAFYFNAN